MTPQGNNNNNIGGNTTTQASQPAVDYDSDAAVVTGAMGLVRLEAAEQKRLMGHMKEMLMGHFPK